MRNSRKEITRPVYISSIQTIFIQTRATEEIGQSDKVKKARGFKVHASYVSNGRKEARSKKKSYDSCPQSPMRICADVLPDGLLPKDSIRRITSMPSTTLPNTTCLPSSQLVGAVQMKNCEPLVFLPEFAIERTPGPVCLSEKFSSSNLEP